MGEDRNSISLPDRVRQRVALMSRRVVGPYPANTHTGEDGRVVASITRDLTLRLLETVGVGLRVIGAADGCVWGCC